MSNLEVSIVTVQTLHLGAGGGGPLVQLRAVLRLDAVHAPRPLLEVQPGTGEAAKLPAVLHTVETAAAVLLVVSEGHNPYLRFHCIHGMKYSKSYFGVIEERIPQSCSESLLVSEICFN